MVVKPIAKLSVIHDREQCERIDKQFGNDRRQDDLLVAKQSVELIRGGHRVNDLQVAATDGL